jgi:hypothetical protein
LVRKVLNHLDFDIKERGKGRVDTLDAIMQADLQSEVLEFAITSFGRGDVLNTKDKIKIKGILPEAYDNLNVQYYKEGSSASPSSIGIEVIGSNGIIAEFDPAIANIDNGFYTFKALISKGDSKEVDQVTVYFDDSMKQGWPKSIAKPLSQTMPLSYGQPIIEDLNNDNEKEIIFAYQNMIYVYQKNGQLLSGWPKIFMSLPNIDLTNPTEALEIYEFQEEPSVGDLNNDGFKETVIGDLEGNLHVFQSNGDYYSGWPMQLGENIINPITLEDINNDGLMGVVRNRKLVEHECTD